MEDYRLDQSGQEVQDILNGAAMQSDLTAETERATEAEQTLQGNIDAEVTRIDALEEKVPSDASVSNKLATESYVYDLVATATATFRGTFNLVSDLHLTLDATEFQIATQLALAIATADNNDYCFIQVPTSSETPTEIKEIDRYKFNGTAWGFEYKLNNSGFTTAQWSAINSGITSGDVSKLAALPTNAQLTTLLAGKQDVLTFDNVPTEGSSRPVKSGGVYSAINDEKTARETADSSLSSAIEAILLLIPSAATSLNKLADKEFVNSSITTASATFRGTYNLVTNLSLTVSATHAQIATALAGAVSDEDNNDYAFVQIPTSDATPTQIAKTERYKFNGTAWEYEYDLNNSGYTAAQWAAINSGITEALVTKLSALPTNAELTTALGVLTSSITTINQKIPSAASQANQLVDIAAMESYIVQVLDVLTASFNVTSSDGHVTVSISQVDGKITSLALTTLDIASAASLSLVEGRVTTAEGNISTNSADIAILQDAYAALTQSALVVVQPTDTWPVASPATSTIYRVVDRVNTPPQYYSDYMWNGTAMVLMATYDNAIDQRPKKGSQNLVTSGGVFDNMGALDVSELNATENPHTLAQYVDLSAALAVVPTDYQKGGMSIKFVQSSDNKYVQYRLMANTFSTTVGDWQGVDEEPVEDSDNFVKSGGVANVNGYYMASGPYLEMVKGNDGKLIRYTRKNGEHVICPPLNIRTLNMGYSLKLEAGHDDTNLTYLVDLDNKLVSRLNKYGILMLPRIESPSLNNIKRQINYLIKRNERNNVDVQWENKKIWWCGTSIPAGGYPQLVGNLLGVSNMWNEAVGGSCANGEILSNTTYYWCIAHMGQSILNKMQILEDCYDIDWVNKTVAPGTNTRNLSEIPECNNWADFMHVLYLALAQSYQFKLVVKYLITDSVDRETYLQNAFGDYDWSSIKQDFIPAELNALSFIGTPDLFVIDHSVNDVHPNTPDIQTFDITTYAGALNTYINLIKQYAPHAQILLVSSYYPWAIHTSNGVPIEDKYYGDMILEEQQIAKNWQLEFIDMSKHLPMSSSIKMTTSGYWDENRQWHNDGFTWSENGSEYITNMYINSYFTDRSIATIKAWFNPRIDAVSGKWVYDTWPRFMYMWDGLHPHNNGTTQLLDFYAKVLYYFIKNISIGY